MKKLVFLSVLVAIVLIGCQKNDICIESMPSTPRVVIEFRDADRPVRIKAVSSFNLREIDTDQFYYEEPVSDTLAFMPLPTNKESVTFELIIHQNDSTALKRSIVKVNYSPEEEYVSMACGFRNRFSHLEASTTENEWIKDLKIPDSTLVDNEETTHIYIYH